MITALMDILNNCYECGDFLMMEIVAKTIQHTIPDEIISLHFLGLAYLRTGRANEGLALMSKLRQVVRAKITATDGKQNGNDVPTAAAVCYREATETNGALARSWRAATLELERYSAIDDAAGKVCASSSPGG